MPLELGESIRTRMFPMAVAGIASPLSRMTNDVPGLSELSDDFCGCGDSPNSANRTRGDGVDDRMSKRNLKSPNLVRVVRTQPARSVTVTTPSLTLRRSSPG